MKQVWVNALDLVGHGLDDPGCGMAHTGHGDARAEVDQLVAVHVDDHGTGAAVDVDGQHRAHPAGHRPGPALLEGA